MAYLVNNNVLISNDRDLLGVGTAGINTALYVGSDIQLDASSGIITATSFVGSGIGLTGINANVIVSDGIPTGISTTEGDLYYDSTDLKLFTYYDNNWVEASPVPPGATTLEVTNDAGITTAQIDLLTETLILSGTGNEIEVGVNSSTNTLTFGLTDEVEITTSLQVGAGVSIYSGIITSANGTPVTYYGDGSNLTGISLDPAADFITSGNIQAGVITATTSLEATASSGVGLTVTSDAFIGGSVSVGSSLTSNQVYANAVINPLDVASKIDFNGLGMFIQKDVYHQTGQFIFGGSVRPLNDNTIDLGTVSEGFRDLYLERELIGNNSTDISGINSVTASTYYGSGEFLTDISASAVEGVDASEASGDFPMPFLSGFVGAGLSIMTDNTSNEQFTYSPSTGILKAKEFDALSDARLKTNIVDIEDALGKVDQLRGVEYDWTNGSGSSVGIIAQEVQEVYPQLVSDNGERLTVNYNGLVGLLIAAVKELGAELKDLKSRM